MSHFPLPVDLPVPVDDGAAKHLIGQTFPQVSFAATDGSVVHLGELNQTVVIYVYPRTGKPGEPLPEGWNQIPGARGCTPQSCGFSNRFLQFQQKGIKVFGLSSQNTEYQQQVWKRLDLPFVLLSDTQFKLKGTLALPTFFVSGMELYKRITLVIKDKEIVKVFYPVFPPDQNAEQVLTWIENS